MKKALFIFLSLMIFLTLTACDQGLTVPSDMTFPTGITSDEETSDLITEIPTTEFQSEENTTLLPTETPTTVQTEEPTTEVPTEVPTTIEPTTEVPTGEPTTEVPTTMVREITINLDALGGSLENTILVFLENSQNVILPVPSKEGYTFVEWYDSLNFENEFIFSDDLADEVTIYAKYTPNQYTIVFEENGGSLVADIVDLYNEPLIEPNHPERAGYSFAGWYSDEELSNLYTFSTMPLNGMVLYAKWIPNQYQISYFDEVDSFMVDFYNTSYTSFIFMNDFTIYASGNTYLDSGETLWTTFRPINDYFPLHDDEVIISISGHRQLFALTSENRVFAWGLNAYGSLGVGDNVTKYSPIDITSQFALAEDESIIFIDGDYDNS
ncbi:MAG: InlB B-repeat-containing protein, partial [Candidatus Izemoplasmatales bacterium]